MNLLKRSLIGGLIVASVLLLVAVCGVLSAPLWIDSNAVKKEIAALVQRATGDVVQLDRLQLHMFPPVSVEIARPRYFASGNSQITAEAAVIGLDPWALIFGRVQPRNINLTGLQATIQVPAAAPGAEPFSLATVDRQLRDVMAQLKDMAPNLGATADDAAITLLMAGRAPFMLRKINVRAQTSGGRLDGELACASDLWERMALKFSIAGDDLKGSGRLEFVGLQASRLEGLLGGSSDWPLIEAEVIGSIDWRMQGLSEMHAEAIAFSPRVLLRRNSSTQTFDGVNFALGLDTKGTAMALHLHDLYVRTPHLLLGVKLTRDARGHHGLEVQASGVDLPALQAAASNLAPDIPWISNAPMSLTEGTLNALELRSSAGDLSQLLDPSLLAGEAAFEGVAFDVARPALKLSATAGRVTLDRGELRGNSIRARLGKSTLRNGNMSVNLLNRPVALQADAVVALDLAEALAVARKVISRKDVRRHLDAVEKLEGNALAHVALSGNLPSLNTSIDVSELAFSLRHRDVPLPVKLSRGRVRYAGDALSISDAAGEVGRSGFSDLDASMNLAPPYQFDLTQFTALLSMDELFPIAASRPELRTAIAELQAVTGEITLTNVQADGSLQAVEALHFRVGASPRGMKIQARRFAPQILLDGGIVDITNRRIEVADVGFTALDSELRVSGHSENYQAGISAVDAVVYGRLGAKMLDWIYQTTEIPRALQVRAPLRLADAKVGWKNSGAIAFNGKINVAGTADLLVDARKTDGSLNLERVTLKDPSSDVSFGGELAGKVVKAWFKGKLAGETVKHVFVEPAVSIGRLEGDLTMGIDLEKPEEMQAKGWLEAMAVAAPGYHSIPVSIENLSLTADGRKITLGDTIVYSGENRAVLSGSVYREDKRFIVDADVRAERIVLPESLTDSKASDKGEGGKRQFNLEELPVAGRLGVNLRSVEAGPLKLAPLIAEARVSGAKLDLQIAQAALCGITLSGGVVGAMDDLRLTGTLSARDTAFADSIGCLTEGRVEGSGHMDVDANFIARGAPGQFRENIGGRFSLHARDGNFEKFDTLNRVFAVLNVTEIARGKHLAVSEKGMRYRLLSAKGTLEGKLLHFDELTLDAPTVYLAATGQVDYGSGKMAMDVLVAPLQTANAILDKIPLLNRIFGSAIFALPVQIVGTVQHPIVVPLGPGAVATRMTSIIANTLKLPFDAINVFSPNAAEGAKAPDAEKK